MKQKWSTRFMWSARDDLRRIERATALRILRKLADLENDPYGLGSTELVGEPGYRRLRVGAHRVIYSLEQGRLIIWVIIVGHRSEVYKQADRLDGSAG